MNPPTAIINAITPTTFSTCSTPVPHSHILTHSPNLTQPHPPPFRAATKGTLFALLMSAFNGAGLVSGELGALLTAALGVTDSDFTNLAPLTLACALASLLPLPLLAALESPEPTLSPLPLGHDLGGQPPPPLISAGGCDHEPNGASEN